jgi:aromatic amino acid aminotransferase I
MFIFLAIHIDQHPDYARLVHKGEDAIRVLTEKLWIECAEDLVSISSFNVQLPR